MMRRTGAILLAYAVTAAMVPFLFLGAAIIWPMPLPRSFFLASGFELWLAMALTGLVAGMPGFALGRLALWWSGHTSMVAFALAGAAAGALAVVLLCLPGELWAIRRYNLDLVGAAVGGLAGVIYWQAERLVGAWMGKAHQRPGGGR